LGKRICEALNCLIEVLFPDKKFCLYCGKLEEYRFGLCDFCYAEVLKNKRTNKILRQYPLKVSFDEAYSVFSYEKMARDIIIKFKYKEKIELSLVIAYFMKELLDELNLKFDCIVPVPIFKSKKSKRGFNQALAIADNLSRLTFVPVLDCVEKIKNTKSQTLFNDYDRWYNVKEAFKCKKDLTGKTVLLVDDVFTTGATAHYVSYALKECNAKKIIVLTFAS